jgi:hypothetical protein
MDKMNLDDMISLYGKRYPYSDGFNYNKKQLLNFDKADNDFEPICLLGKNWEIIKLDFYEFVGN